MLETVILSLLSALGIVLIIWCICGRLLLPMDGEGFCVIFADRSEESNRQIRAYTYLLHSGLMQIPLCVVDLGLDPDERKRLETYETANLWVFSPQQWVDFIETESFGRVSGT